MNIYQLKGIGNARRALRVLCLVLVPVFQNGDQSLQKSAVKILLGNFCLVFRSVLKRHVGHDGMP